MTAPAWVETWEPPVGTPDWTWERRHDLWVYAMALLSRGSITIGWGKGRNVTPPEIMTFTAERLSQRAFDKALRLLLDNPPPEPPEKTVRAPRASWTPFKPAPPWPQPLPSVLRWAFLAYSCYPDDPDAQRLWRLAQEIDAKVALDKPVTMPWKSYWVCSRELFITATKEVDAMHLPAAVRDTLNKRTIWNLLLDARALGYEDESKTAGADGGAVQDEDFLPDGSTGRVGGPGPGGAAVPPDDDGVPDGLEAVDAEGDL